MIIDKDTAKITAKKLLEIEAIKLNPDKPFQWASGWQSPIYCDNRLALSYPEVRSFIAARFAKAIQNKYPDVEVIAGVATGAIAVGVLVADKLGLPFVYVRPKPKEHGRKNQIEGHLNEEAKVLVIEDLISTGKSSINAVKALQTVGAHVLGMFAIFSYAFPQAEVLFTKEKIQLYVLSNYNYLLELALEAGRINKNEAALLATWRQDPAAWTQKVKSKK